MYIPSHYHTMDQEAAFLFMQRYNFSLLISTSANAPVATHLPFLVSKNPEGQIILHSHMARANSQLTSLGAATVLVIFSGPHAYISPRHYEKEMNVPTWNYIAVHAYGKVQLISDETETLQVLEKTILCFEQGYLQQWEKQPTAYKDAMLKGLCAFKINVTEIQAKEKLSQNKTASERANIIRALQSSDLSHEKQLAEYMQLKEKDSL